MKEQQQQKNMVEEYHHDMFPVEELEVSIGGCTRMIDVPVSNRISSGIRYTIYPYFVQLYLSFCYTTSNFRNDVNFEDGFIEVLATTQFSSFLQFAGRKRSEEQLMS
ncbi:glucose-1-phosphate adenylyltransferase large subunit 2, chloroplastic-like [Papaver somniferum]|uniref:glucose-1-phosphate adenylyltransferase large subunit 2, chloroplastic-like n=1 Tax=Papaver somniferum TaxID=3469 RepID=UPI000E6FB8C2|nr:glucose-1-phosphate adenylyltransferase large subunit 2, chloroplastic-like [Papaver somniferum]XP_026381459.1 glucose-1-phosphate adenylyltransferase large subunit 2, chloroplastic-like [Papaver somniferum]